MSVSGVDSPVRRMRLTRGTTDLLWYSLSMAATGTVRSETKSEKTLGGGVALVEEVEGVAVEVLVVEEDDMEMESGMIAGGGGIVTTECVGSALLVEEEASGVDGSRSMLVSGGGVTGRVTEEGGGPGAARGSSGVSSRST